MTPALPSDYAIDLVLEVEKGFVDHPSDPGGPTNFGITQRTLGAYLGRPATRDDVRALTRAQAKLIYHSLYWSPARLDLLTDPLTAAIIFDQCVNRGANTAIRALQVTLVKDFRAKVAVDGRLGPATAVAVNTISQRRLAWRYLVGCQRFYVELVRKNPGQMVFLLGWLERTWRLMDLLA